MRILAPELQLCYGNWKADRVGKKTYSGWWQTRKDGVDDEEDDDDDTEKTEAGPMGGKDVNDVAPMDVDKDTAASSNAGNVDNVPVPTAVPTVPEVPDVPVVPEVPDIPDVLVVPDVPDAPDITNTTDISDATTNVPNVPNTPVAPVVTTDATAEKQGSSSSGSKRPRSEFQPSPSSAPGRDPEASPPVKRARSEDLAQAAIEKHNVVLFDKSLELPLPFTFDDDAMPVDRTTESSTQEDCGGDDITMANTSEDEVATGSQLALPTHPQTQTIPTSSESTAQPPTSTPSGTALKIKIAPKRVAQTSTVAGASTSAGSSTSTSAAKATKKSRKGTKTSPGGRTLIPKAIKSTKLPDELLTMKGTRPGTAAKAHHLANSPPGATVGQFWAWLAKIDLDLWAAFHDVP
ncbi:hypothetical protein AAF712_013451 [Marasmius tenuissimus]|uniref:Uncharacterized protein n=1 Tax=Marasmius tenuissimus TaxID=585030 RepID=A0ABR2ZEW7_9AGAR